MFDHRIIHVEIGGIFINCRSRLFTHWPGVFYILIKLSSCSVCTKSNFSTISYLCLRNIQVFCDLSFIEYVMELANIQFMLPLLNLYTMFLQKYFL